MQPNLKRLGIVAREMAVDIAAAAYSPDIVQHIPGVSMRRRTRYRECMGLVRSLPRHTCLKPQVPLRHLPDGVMSRRAMHRHSGAIGLFRISGRSRA